MRSAVVGAIMMAAGAPTLAQDAATSLTIYSSAQPGGIPAEWYRPTPGNPVPTGGGHIPGYAFVREERPFTIGSGRTTVRFPDVAALIDPTTVTFESLTDPKGTRVLEQNFQFDLVGGPALLQKFIDREISVTTETGTSAEVVQGTLLSTTGGLIVRSKDGRVRILSKYSEVSLPELPGGLITRPTLLWDVQSSNAGAQRVRVGYETKGITWWADYNLIFTEGAAHGAGTLDVGAWVSILNQSGGAFKDAKLKLVAGDVGRAPIPMENMPMGSPARSEPLGLDAGFQSKAFFEYYLYTLGRPATIPDNSTKQIELFPAASKVPAQRVLVYDGQGGLMRGWGGPAQDQGFGVQTIPDVHVYLRFKNSAAGGLGIPLPAGRVRISKQDPADGALEFIGEDVIRHTPRDETVLLKLGTAFDVVGERRQVGFRVDNSRRWMEERIEVEIRNHKDEDVSVIVQERMYRWTNWEITKNQGEYDTLDARTLHFPVKVDKHGTATISYTVRYTW